MRAHGMCVMAVSLTVGVSGAMGVIVSAGGAGGLAAEAEFTLVNATTLRVRVKNTSTGVPMGFSNSDQILTGVSWDFGAVGANAGEAMITGGLVRTGLMSQSVNFSVANVGANADVSGEWGSGNGGSGLAFTNFISALQAGSTQFAGANLDGPGNLNGPQGGIVASPAIVALGGLGAIQDEVVATLNLSQSLSNLDFLGTNLVRFEFGSDAAFLTTPTPGSAGLVLIGAMFAFRRRR